MKRLSIFSSLLFLLLFIAAAEEIEARRPHYGRLLRPPHAKRKTRVSFYYQDPRGPRRPPPVQQLLERTDDDVCRQFNRARRRRTCRQRLLRQSIKRQDDQTFSNFGPYFSGMADRFSETMINSYRVQYNEKQQSCPKVPTDRTFYCDPEVEHACWSVGVPDVDCEDRALCCFDGCKNVCFHPDQVEVIGINNNDLATPVPYQEAGTTQDAKCPVITAESRDFCSSFEPNCWSAGTFDLDCPDAGLCCFDGCHNRCQKDFPNQSAAKPEPILPNIAYNANQEIPSSTTDRHQPENEISPAAINAYQSINQREPTLILHIYGPPQTIAQVHQGSHVLPDNISHRRTFQEKACPYLGHKPYDECLLNVSSRSGGNPCQSPGSRLDPACHGELCCFDGCSYRCSSSSSSASVEKSIVNVCPSMARSQCRLQLGRHECLSSSDCRLGDQCCFDGCINVCKEEANVAHNALHNNYFYGRK